MTTEDVGMLIYVCLEGGIKMVFFAMWSVPQNVQTHNYFVKVQQRATAVEMLMFVLIKESTKTATHVLGYAQCNAANSKLKHQEERTTEVANCHLLAKVSSRKC